MNIDDIVLEFPVPGDPISMNDKPTSRRSPDHERSHDPHPTFPQTPPSNPLTSGDDSAILVT